MGNTHEWALVKSFFVLVMKRVDLSEEDQTLLVLRVDPGLASEELVLVMRDDEAPLDAGARKRESAKLRKRLQVLEAELQAAEGEPVRDSLRDAVELREAAAATVVASASRPTPESPEPLRNG